MGSLLLACRLVLTALLAVAAGAKLADGAGTRRSLASFGVPEGLTPAAAVALPVVELAVAGALVPVDSAWAGALAATALLVVFTGAVAVAIVRGADADCHCFGRLSSAGVGRGTLARNGLLLVPAAFVAIAGAHDAGAAAPVWLGGIALAAGVALNFAYLFQLMQQNGRLWAELEELRAGRPAAPHRLPLGGPAPAVTLTELSGRRVGLGDLLDGERGVLLVFTDPRCSACGPLWTHVGRRQRDPGSDPRPVLVSLGSAEEIRAKVSDHGIERVLLADDFEVARAFGVSGLPGAIAVDARGRIAGAPAVGAPPVLALLGEPSGELRLVEVDHG